MQESFLTNAFLFNYKFYIDMSVKFENVYL